MNPSPLHAQHAGLHLVDYDGGQVPAHYGDPDTELDALQSGCGILDLSPVAIVRLSGADTRRFANAQLSHNIRDLPTGGLRHCVITDRKGRIEGMADALLVEDRELILLGAGSSAEWLIERLDSFIIMDPLELEDLGQDLALMSLQGPGAEAVALALGVPLPERAVARWAGGYVARNDRCAAGGVDLLAPASDWPALWQAAVAAGARPCGVEALEAARVLRGLPRWPQDMGERAFIHEMRLVSRVAAFDKGCYIGQEVINRMETMGKVNRQLMGLQIEGQGTAGDAVVLGDQAVGTLSSVARAGGRTLGLAVLRTAAGPGSDVFIGEQRAPARVCELPF